jgi:CubicO group peptidase (beta-lactamase class C family)
MKTNLFLLFLAGTICVSAQTWTQERKNKIDETVRNPFTKALVVYQNGKLEYVYGDVHKTYHIFSVRKSLMSLLYGIYAQQEKINLQTTLTELGIDDRRKLTPEEKQATVLHLLQSRSGIYHPAAYETPGMLKNRPPRGQFKPGEHWFYNNWDFNALTTIFEKQTGKSVFDVFEERIAKPIGMRDFDLRKQKYFTDSVSIHAAPLWYMSASDLGVLGLLLLNRGQWNNQSIIPTTWIEESTAPYSDIGILGGYGYSWWAAKNQEHFPFVKLPDGTYSARGTGEQILLVIPALQMVVVHLTEVNSPTDSMM